MARPSVQGSGVQIQSLIVSMLCGQALTAFADDSAIAKVFNPAKSKIVAITTSVLGKGGTFEGGTLDVKVGNNSLLTTPFDIAAIAAGTPVEKVGAALSSHAASVAQDAAIVLSTDVTNGSSPTWKGVTVQIDFIPLAG